MFDNLEKLAVAMGFAGINPEFLTAMQGQVGAFGRLAAQHGLAVEVGFAAKREYHAMLEQGRAMFAACSAEVPPETEDRRALVALRISLARVAQAAGVPLAGVGLPDDVQYTALHAAACTRERGWNALAGQVAESVERDRRQLGDWEAWSREADAKEAGLRG